MYCVDLIEDIPGNEFGRLLSGGRVKILIRNLPLLVILYGTVAEIYPRYLAFNHD